MDTKQWGPGLWKAMHAMTFNYPERPTLMDQVHMKLFFEHLVHLLPCPYCQESYRQFLTELPIDDWLGSRARLTQWLYQIHNKVNDRLRSQGQSVPPNPAFEEVAARYEQMRASCDAVTHTCSAKQGACSLPPHLQAPISKQAPKPAQQSGGARSRRRR